MVDRKKIERKLPSLISNGSLELDRYTYRAHIFKKKQPQIQQQFNHKLCVLLDEYKNKVDSVFQNGKKK